MKKILLLGAVTAMVVIAACSKKTIPQTSQTAEAEKKSSAVSYAGQVKQLIESKCSPCHIPSKGGNKAALDNFDNARKFADDIIRRINLNPDERGFMPFRNAKLSAEEIAVFTKWKEEGLSEN